MLKYLYVKSFCRDSLFLTPTFDFFFKVPITKKRKEREITRRDSLGRILASKVPDGLHDFEMSQILGYDI